MPSKTISNSLRDIRDNVDLALRFVEGHWLKSFLDDRRTAYAVTRCLGIISEASRRIPDAFKAHHPHLPWASLAATENVYRRDYEGRLDRFVWRTVHENLAPSRTPVDA
jgi:uncharacterized protein with HEPN domain